MRRLRLRAGLGVLTSAVFIGALCAGASVPKHPEKMPTLGTPSYTRDVAPILFQECATCHHPGTAAPFSLLTYADAQRRAPLIVAVTRAHYMPPWLPGRDCGPFAGARGLTDSQRLTLAAWAAAGTPEGPASALPAGPKFQEGWKMGPPDVVLQMPHSYTVSPDGSEPCRSFLFPTSFGHDVWISAVDYKASCPRVVRRAALFADSTGQARKQQAQSGAFGWTDFPQSALTSRTRLGEWTPGSASIALPEGQAFCLKSGTDLVLQLHTEPDGLAEAEQSQISLYLVKRAEAEPVTLSLGAYDLALRTNEQAEMTDSFVLPVAAKIFGISPHGSEVCRSVQVEAALPSGKSMTLLHIPSYNSDWAEPLRYAQAVAIPAGTRLTLHSTYDNSRTNPRNAEGALMPMRSAPGCSEESAGVQLTLLASPADAEPLASAVQAKPGDTPVVVRSGGIGHG